MGLSLIMLFLIASIFSLHTRAYFSLFNVIIVSVGIYKVILHSKALPEKFSYARSFTSGLLSGLVATIIFTFFFTLYTAEISPNYLMELLSVFKVDYNVHVGLVIFTVAVMGFSTTIVVTLSCMQLLKEPLKVPQNI